MERDAFDGVLCHVFVGSIAVTMLIEGPEDDVTAALDDLHQSMVDGSFTVEYKGYTLHTSGHLYVEGEPYSATKVNIMLSCLVYDHNEFIIY